MEQQTPWQKVLARIYGTSFVSHEVAEEIGCDSSLIRHVWAGSRGIGIIPHRWHEPLKRAGEKRGIDLTADDFLP